MSLLFEVLNDKSVITVVNEIPVPTREKAESEIIVVAHRLVESGCDKWETVRLVVEFARQFVGTEATPVAKLNAVQSVQAAWGINQTPVAIERRPSLDPPDNLDKLQMLALLSELLPRQEGAVRKIYNELLRSFAEDYPEMPDAELRAEVVRCCHEKVREHNRLGYTPTESWFVARKSKNDVPSREEFLKRTPLAESRLECVRRENGEAFYSLKSLDPKCEASLVVPTGDSVVLERLERRYLILKSSRSKDANWRLSFHNRFEGRSGRIDREVPLEAVISRYKIIDGDKVAEFTAEALEQTEANRIGKEIRNPLSFEEWMTNSSAPSAVGIAKGKRPAGKFRSGKGGGTDDRSTSFVESVQVGGYTRSGRTAHPDDLPTRDLEKADGGDVLVQDKTPLRISELLVEQDIQHKQDTDGNDVVVESDEKDWVDPEQNQA